MTTSTVGTSTVGVVTAAAAATAVGGIPSFKYLFDIAIGYAIYNNSIYIIELFIFLLQFIGIRYYIIYGDKDNYRNFKKNLEPHIKYTNVRRVNGIESYSGYFIGYKCIGLFENTSKYKEDDKLYLITTVNFYKSLIEDKLTSLNINNNNKTVIDNSDNDKSDSDSSEEKSLIKKVKPNQEKSFVKVYIRSGRYDNFYYSTLKLDVSHIEPIGDQCKITDDIIRLYKTKNRTTVFIHGVTCAGKSSIGYLVAKQLKGSFCHSFNPTDPGDQFCNMIREFNESDNEEGHPIVIVLEEANEIIHAVHNKTIGRNYKIPTPVTDKSSWCSFLDDMVFYKKVILILTSNESKEAIDALDPAYLREGRIDATYNMSKSLTFC